VVSPPPEDVEEKLLSRRALSGEFVRPSYEDYCLSSVPSTILSMFGVDNGRPRIPRGELEIGGQAEKLILFVIDGLGYYDVKRQLGDGRFFQAAASKGVLAPITSVFPSTTAAALTTLSTGLTPQEHCLPEWFVYMREIEQVIATLPFSAVGDRGRDRLVGRLRPSALYSGTSVDRLLRRHGVDALSFVNAGLAKTVYSKRSHSGSEIVPYITSSDLMASLRKRVEEAKRRTYFYVYWDRVDTIGHAYGPGSEESRSEISLLSYLLKTELVDRLSTRAASETTLMLTADHGQIPVDPSTTRYLNGMSAVMDGLATTSSGTRIPPWGSARDVYLAVQAEKLDSVSAHLKRRLGRKALVLRTGEAVRSGIFGIGKPRPRFVARVGDLMVLPRKRNLVWYRYWRRDRLKIRGHHGGMNPGEMLIPLVVSSALELR
jgi:predicted AlkP superfamily pyrophosphatase or phosphodiesterase